MIFIYSKIDLRIVLNNDEFLVQLKRVNNIEINLDKQLDIVAIQILQLIFTQNLNYK